MDSVQVILDLLDAAIEQAENELLSEQRGLEDLRCPTGPAGAGVDHPNQFGALIDSGSVITY